MFRLLFYITFIFAFFSCLVCDYKLVFQNSCLKLLLAVDDYANNILFFIYQSNFISAYVFVCVLERNPYDVGVIDKNTN